MPSKLEIWGWLLVLAAALLLAGDAWAIATTLTRRDQLWLGVSAAVFSLLYARSVRARARAQKRDQREWQRVMQRLP